MLLLLLGLLSVPARAAGPVQPDGCWTLKPEECAAQPACKPGHWMCDYVPAGKTFQEVCPHGGKGSCEPKTAWELCCPLDSKACLLFDACRPKPWTCAAGPTETCVYGAAGSCAPKPASYMTAEPRCDLKSAKEGAQPPQPPQPPKPAKPAFQLMGFKDSGEYEHFILDIRRRNKLISQKDYEKELKKLQAPKTGP